MKLKRLLQFAWASLPTLLGLIYAYTFVALGWYKFVGRDGDALIFSHRRQKGPKWLSRYWGYWGGHTIGNVIVLAWPDHWVLPHEKHHVGQYMRLGPFFIVIYAMGYIASYFSGENSYAMNPLEIAARRSNGEPVDVSKKF